MHYHKQCYKSTVKGRSNSNEYIISKLFGLNVDGISFADDIHNMNHHITLHGCQITADGTVCSIVCSGNYQAYQSCRLFGMIIYCRPTDFPHKGSEMQEAFHDTKISASSFAEYVDFNLLYATKIYECIFA